MNKLYTLLGALLLTLSVTSCHDDADTFVNYSFNDNLAFAEAENSYAGKFRVLWNGLSQYYTLWDYEKAHGLDWDQVYDTYLPQFETLDEQETVTDAELTKLLKTVVAPLHDGHMYVQMKNHQTGKYVGVSPSEARYVTREDVEASEGFEPELSGYKDNGSFKELQQYDSHVTAQLDAVFATKGKGYMWVTDKINELEAKSQQTDGDAIMLKGLNYFKEQFLKIYFMRLRESEKLPLYNQLVTECAYLDIPGVELINTGFVDAGINVKYALTSDNIAYFYFSDFSLTPYLNSYAVQESFPNLDDSTAEKIAHVRKVWTAWFDAIQTLHKSGQLKGVVVDVRSNGGGMMSDEQYVLGSLLPAGGFQCGWERFKRGTGRYDYSPLMPMHCETMEEPHEVIDDVPVVVLANCRSVSMSELTSLIVKLMPNGRLIGKRTYGGLCGLTGNEESSDNYSGYIGVENVTPVYVYLPTATTFTMDKEILEGVGVTPDIEVDLKDSEDQSDSQLDRALQYIRTGN